MIQHIPLNLRSRYVFCTAPLNRKEPFVCTTLLKVSYFFPSKNMVFILDQEGFGALELFLLWDLLSDHLRAFLKCSQVA